FAAGATITAYDPVAMHESQRICGDEPRLRYADGPMAALRDADALVIVTEWKEFRSPDFAAIKSAEEPAIFDGRNSTILGSCACRGSSTSRLDGERKSPPYLKSSHH
ncbi:MAG: hypothetical protein IPO75_17375, partial [Betaproteobacteria bacterium]|nr:hypothetical protein [Betaproteobacteria bacterium]